MYKHNQSNQNSLSAMPNIYINCCLKLDFQKVDLHTGGKLSIHGTKHHKDNHLQSLVYPS